MNNGQANCILQVCCLRPEATTALADLMVEEVGCDKETALSVATWLNQNFDLAPHGLLKPYNNVIAALARDGMVPATTGVVPPPKG